MRAMVPFPLAFRADEHQDFLLAHVGEEAVPEPLAHAAERFGRRQARRSSGGSQAARASTSAA